MLAVRRFAFIAPLAALGCGAGDTRPSPEGHEPRPGEWEVTASLAGTSGLGLDEQDEAEVKALIGRPQVGRRCIRGGTPAVGDPFLGDRCTYTRIADHGGIADRVAACRTRAQGSVDTVELKGTRSAERYAFRIVSRRTDAATGRLINSVVTRKEGRWIGPCPDQPQSRQ